MPVKGDKNRPPKKRKLSSTPTNERPAKKKKVPKAPRKSVRRAVTEHPVSEGSTGLQQGEEYAFQPEEWYALQDVPLAFYGGDNSIHVTEQDILQEGFSFVNFSSPVPLSPEYNESRVQEGEKKDEQQLVVVNGGGREIVPIQHVADNKKKRAYTKKDGVKYGRKAVTMDKIENPLRRKTCYDKRSKGFLKKAAELGFRCDAEIMTIVRYPDTGEIVTYSNVRDQANFIRDSYMQTGEPYVKAFRPEDYWNGLSDLKQLYNGVRPKMQPGRKRTKSLRQDKQLALCDQREPAEELQPYDNRMFPRQMIEGLKTKGYEKHPSHLIRYEPEENAGEMSIFGMDGLSAEDVDSYITAGHLYVDDPTPHRPMEDVSFLSLIEGPTAQTLLTGIQDSIRLLPTGGEVTQPCDHFAEVPQVSRKEELQYEKVVSLSVTRERIEIETVVTALTQITTKLRADTFTFQKIVDELSSKGTDFGRPNCEEYVDGFFENAISPYSFDV